MCKFCNALKVKKQIAAFNRIHEPDEEIRFRAAIVSRLFLKGKRGCQGSVTDAGFRGCGYELNFCPECGRDLREKVQKDEG